MRAGSGFAPTFVLLLGVDKNTEAFHSLLQNNNRARAFACVYLPRIENNTSHSDRPTREEELSCHFYPFARENKRFWRACFSFSLSFCGQHPSAVKKEAARISNKNSPPPQNDTLFSSLLRERGRIIENK